MDPVDLREGLGESRAPVAQRLDAGLGEPAVTEDAVGGTGSGAYERGAGGGTDPVRVGAEQAEDLLGEAVPGGLAGVGAVVDAGRGGAGQGSAAQLDQQTRQIGAPGGLTALVVDDVEGVLDAPELDHRADEVRAAGAVEPGGADDVTALDPEHGLLAGQLGAAVGAAGRGGGGLRVRLLGVPGEDVVRGDVQQDGAGAGAGGGQVGRAVAVARERLGRPAPGG